MKGDRPIAEIVADLRARGMNYAADRFLEQTGYQECKVVSAFTWLNSPQGHMFWWYIAVKCGELNDYPGYR
jgi:hypothetical protein